MIIAKVGDWCFYEYKLSQVKKVNADGRVIEVSDGFISTSNGGYGFHIKPLTLRNKIISGVFEGISNELHEKGNAGLNYPDIHNHFVDLWLQACETEDTEDGNKELTGIYNQIRAFSKKLIEFSQYGPEIDGVKILRTR